MSRSSHNSNSNSQFTCSIVTSKDGTKISCRSIGQGPGMIVIHGALSNSSDYKKLAAELSDSFTVHVVDRRGRGESGPQGGSYSMTKECEDIQALQVATGAKFIFGHSYGGLVALEFAKAFGSPARIAVYEPGVSINRSIPTDWLSDYKKSLEKQDLLSAFTIFVKALNPSAPMRWLPDWYIKLILRIVLWGGKWNKIKDQLSENYYEHSEVRRLDSSFESYGSIKAVPLLMAGGKSPEWAHNTAKILGKTIPEAKSVVLPHLDHFGPYDENSPEVIAKLLKEFFKTA